MKERFEEIVVEVIAIDDDVITTSGDPMRVMDEDGTLPFIDMD